MLNCLLSGFANFRLSTIPIHLSSNSWSADLLAQQIRDFPAQYHTRTTLGAIAEVLICLPSRFAIFRLGIIPIHLSVDSKHADLPAQWKHSAAGWKLIDSGRALSGSTTNIAMLNAALGAVAWCNIAAAAGAGCARND